MFLNAMAIAEAYTIKTWARFKYCYKRI